MSRGSYSNFGDVFSEVVSDRAADPIEHLLVLTYEFDQEQLLNLTCGRSLEEEMELNRSQLKLLSDIRPLVIYDARKTPPCGKLPQFLELHPYKSPGFSCHHSKAYLVITRKAVRLVLGSFNLTATGLFKNREVMQPYLWSVDSHADIHILRQWTKLLESHYAPRLKASSRSALLPVIEKLKGWLARLPQTAEEKSRLISSGYGNKTGLDALAECWQSWYPGVEPDSLLVISPFFDHSPSEDGIAAALPERFPGLTELSIITDERLLPELSQSHYGRAGTIRNRLFLIPKEMPPSEKERLARRWGTKTIEQLSLTRNLHAKILLLRRGNLALAYLGSANFSGKAWLGHNRELGVAWIEERPDFLRDQIFSHLCVDRKNRYSELSARPSLAGTVEDDEGYREDKLFPDFLEQVLLVPSDDGSGVHFRFECSDVENLAQYRVHWGQTELSIEDGESQSILRADFQALLLGRRNLVFSPLVKPEETYWVPFQYDGKLVAERETLVHPSTRDWLAYYLDPDRDDRENNALPGEEEPDDDDTDPKEDVTDDDGSDGRESNCVIAMQRYLNDFVRIEAQFRERLTDIQGCPDVAQQSTLLKTRVLEPLQGLCRLLDREHPEPSAERLFKFGELRLFVGGLCQTAPAPLRPQFEPLLKQIEAASPSTGCLDDLQSRYWSFVHSQEVAAHA